MINRSQTIMRLLPTGQGFGAIAGLNLTAQRIYEVIVRRFLCIFYPPAEYLKLAIIAKRKEEASLLILK